MMLSIAFCHCAVICAAKPSQLEAPFVVTAGAVFGRLDSCSLLASPVLPEARRDPTRGGPFCYSKLRTPIQGAARSLLDASIKASENDTPPARQIGMRVKAKCERVLIGIEHHRAAEQSEDNREMLKHRHLPASAAEASSSSLEQGHRAACSPANAARMPLATRAVSGLTRRARERLGSIAPPSVDRPWRYFEELRQLSLAKHFERVWFPSTVRRRAAPSRLWIKQLIGLTSVQSKLECCVSTIAGAGMASTNFPWTSSIYREGRGISKGFNGCPLPGDVQ